MIPPYNFDYRSFNQRKARYNELAKKQCKSTEATYVVVTTREGYYGNYFEVTDDDRHYFTNKRTAIAYAQHYSDIYDDVVGVFKMPEFITGVSCQR